MFKCKECGSEYKEKPDYCDCGNDTFDEIKEVTVNVSDKTEVTETHKESQPQQQKETDNIETKPAKTEKPVKTDKISLIIFIICLILSFVVLIFPVNTSVKTDNTTSDEVQNSGSIPAINSIWDNSAPVVQKTELPKTSPVSSEKTEEKKNYKINNDVDKKITNTTSANSLTPKNNNVNPVKNSNVKPKPTNKVEQTKQNDKITTPAPKQKPISTPTSQTTSNTNKVQNEISLNSYKVALRNKIASNIDFASIVGDGTCAITFKIDANGKLVNRNFAQQSENTSLNDAVYNAMLAVPNYKTPPSTYKNTTLKLVVKFVSGNFEVSLD